MPKLSKPSSDIEISPHISENISAHQLDFNVLQNKNCALPESSWTKKTNSLVCSDSFATDFSTMKKKLVSKVPKLSKKEWLKILKILQNNDVKFTENSNGCFVNLAIINDSVIEEIHNFVQMCLDFQMQNNERETQIKEFEEEFENCSKQVFQEYPHPDNDKLSAIKKDKNLNSLEKSIMKENIKHAFSDKQNPIKRKSLTPKYSGMRAKLFKNCRSTSRSSIQGNGHQPTLLMDSNEAEVMMNPQNLNDITHVQTNLQTSGSCDSIQHLTDEIEVRNMSQIDLDIINMRDLDRDESENDSNDEYS